MSSSIAHPGLPPIREVARHALLRHLEQTPVGTRLPSLDEMARDFGVGRNNLQGAMRDLAREGWVVSRPRLGTFVVRQRMESKQKVTGHGRSVRAESTRVLPMSMTSVLTGRRVTFLAHDFQEPMVQIMAMSAGRVLGAAGAEVVELPLVRNVNDAANDEIKLPRGTDLVLGLNPSHGFLRSWQNAIPLVVASTTWHDGCVSKSTYDVVGVDQVHGAALAGEALRDAGFTSACFLKMSPRYGSHRLDSTSQVRLGGFVAGFRNDIPAEYQLDAEGYSLKGGGSCFQQYMQIPSSERPRAIFATSDELAVGFIVAAQAQGLQPGEDFHIVGFDGQRLGRKLHDGPLTTVDVPHKAMGQQVAQLAIERLMNPQRLTQATYLRGEFFPGSTMSKASYSPPS